MIKFKQDDDGVWRPVKIKDQIQPRNTGLAKSNRGRKRTEGK